MTFAEKLAKQLHELSKIYHLEPIEFTVSNIGGPIMQMEIRIEGRFFHEGEKEWDANQNELYILKKIEDLRK